MQLPQALREELEEEATRLRPGELAAAARELSRSYRAGNAAHLSETQRIAYRVVRMPATYAAAHAVLREIATTPITTLLDLGAGPGTVAWAAREIFPGLHTVTEIDRDRGWARAQALDIRQASAFEKHDLVVLAYVLGELDDCSVLTAAWQAASQALVLIEPGTPAGFAVIREARAAVIAMGGHVLAPCPHSQDCPMIAPDWCHFAQRVERSALHRRAKGGSMGYEDEKFSYVILSKTPVEPCGPRILRHPYKGHGYVKLSLCTATGLETVTATKKNKESYRTARQAQWGQCVKL